MSKQFLTVTLEIPFSKVEALSNFVTNQLSAANNVEITKVQTEQTQVEEEKPAPAAKKAKAKKETAPVKQEVVEEETQAEETTTDDDDFMSDEETEEKTQAPTIDDVRANVKSFAGKHGKDKTLKLLAKFKVTSVVDLKQKDYQTVIDLVKQHL